MAYQITYVHKDSCHNPYESITHVGGRSADPQRRPWKLSHQEAIHGIENRQWSFYVRQGEHLVDVVVAVSRFGKKYLTTRADDSEPINLLSLPES